jgi:transcriptional regulator with XRE-family HTH domain
MSVGKRLKMARIDRDIKQYVLAEQIHITAKHLSQIERGVTPHFSVQVLRRLCGAMQLEPHEVYDLLEL